MTNNQLDAQRRLLEQEQKRMFEAWAYQADIHETYRHDAAYDGWQACLEANNICAQVGLDYILLEPGSEPQDNDIVLCSYEYLAGYGTVEYKDRVAFWHEVKDYYNGTITVMPDFHPISAPIIIQRNGKPVIYKGN